ncbi:T9SS type A sorting domain-containing protein [uncultured Winogradskyella sp.]|uniref:T9SS type A sorting domain-containing protein n=1 Tax=Winogradskyella sp. 4-2091 TaxID=3381659 RepID=UPI0026209B2A|nr:T9SS type A sorting domain-containing protein [uncultured Winogradskyella sp.]
MNKPSLFKLIVLIITGISSLQLSAQTNGTYTNDGGSGNGLWTLDTNWTASTIADASGEATIQTDVALNGMTVVEVGSVNITTNTARTFSSGTLQLNGSSSDYIIRSWPSNGTTLDCDVIINANNKQFLIRNTVNSKLIFSAGYTLDLGSNRVDINNQSANPVEINGNVSGTGSFLVEDAGSNGGMIYAASSDFTGFSGNHTTINNPIISNTNSEIVKSGKQIQVRNSGSFTVNVANTINGSISRHKNGIGLVGTVTFNANQESMEQLKIDREELALDFGADVTLVQFSSYDTSPSTGIHGRVDLRNYFSGVLRIGISDTEVSQSLLDTWLIDGVEPADGTITQDASGYIRVPRIASTTANPIDWENGSSWIGGVVPTATDNVIIQGNIQINTDVVVNDFAIIEVGATERVKVEAGHSLTINGDAITKNNLFAYSTSTSFASLIFNGTVNGDIRYYRYVNGVSDGNDLISSPVDQNFSTLANNNSAELVSNTAPNENQKLFGPFNNVNGVYENWVTTDGEIITPGEGYRAGTINGSTIYFKGTVPDSPVANVPVTLTDGGDPTYGPWNLIGNPYPSYLDFGVFWTENESVLNGGSGAYKAIYGYDADDSDGSNYTIWNAINTTSDKITPSQGFYVRTVSGGTVTFTPAMRTHGTSEDFIAGRSSTLNPVLSELFLSNGANNYNTKIYFAENQTRGLDPGYDAGTFTNSTSGIYTNLVENHAGVEFAIQVLPYDDFNDIIVPLGVNSESGTQLTIGLNTETTTIPSNINVYLEDNATNTWTLLNNSDYVFTPSDELNGTGRFYIHYSTNALSVDDNLLNGLQIYSNQSSKTLVIKGQLNSETSAVLYDMQGRLVFQNILNASDTTNTINVGSLKTGVYIVELINDTQNRTQKIIIN